MAENTKTKAFFIDNTSYNSKNPLIIAELGTSHGGDRNKAREMIQAAAEAGAHCIKLQMVFADEILHPNTGEVTLPGGKIRLYDRFLQLEKPPEFYAELKEFAESLGLLFLCTPFGLKSAKILRELQPKMVKIASPELNFCDLLQEIAKWDLPVLLSSGVSTLGDIETAIAVLAGNREWGMGSEDHCSEDNISSELYLDISKSNPNASNPEPYSLLPIPHSPLCLLHCVTAYPAPEADYNLRVLPNLAGIFGVSVGVSDHSLDPEMVPVTAVSQGAAVIEKHFCISRDDPGLDDPIALSPPLFAQMVRAVRRTIELGPEKTLEELSRERGTAAVEAILGSGIKMLAPSERDNYLRTNRSIHALRDIHPGETIQSTDFAVLRTEKILRPGLGPSWAERIVGRTARQFIPAGEGIRFDDI